MTIAVNAEMVINMNSNLKINEKYALTVDEAAEYFNVGEKKLRWVIKEHPDSDFLLSIGTKTLIKREMFSRFLDQITSL